MVGNALEAAELLEARGIDATVIDMRWIKPLDETAILAAAGKHRLIVTVEENTVRGGFGAGVLEVLSDENVSCPVLHLGTPDEFCECGTMDQLIELAHLGPASIADATVERLERLDD
jgi:1-deoxy-D-xylulose-5-phosphate synthase